MAPSMAGQRMLERIDFLDFDLQSRELQWSFLGEPAPCLAQDSVAYRFAGFGSHEVVVYYDLLRFLLTECWKRVSDGKGIAAADEVARLRSVKDGWLECPQPDFRGKSPAYILECERRRLPLTVPAEEAVIDEDCPLCQAMAEDHTPMFCHLDGCNMDDDFPFSFHLTRGEWEAERNRLRQFDEEFKREWAEREGKIAEDASALADDAEAIH